MASSRILVVDDEEDIAEVLGDRLEAWGFDVRVVHSARDGYAAISKQTPDLVILDIQMPEISGLEALVELKRKYPEMPVLILSASTAKETLDKAETLGADGYMLKPFDPEELRSKLGELVPKFFG